MNTADHSRSARDMRPLPLLPATEAPCPMTDKDPASHLRDTALEWLMRVQQAPEDAPLRTALQQWLDADPAHATAYRKAERVWQLTGQLLPATTAQWPQPSADVVTLKPRRRWPQVLAVGIAACLVIALAPRLWLNLQSDYRTGVAEQQSIPLADGSVVRLDAGSAIAVKLGEHRRDVTLLRGQAFFEVAPDAARPFHVQAAGLDVRVTGTAFNVELQPQGQRVAVDHGSVQVTDSRQQVLSPGLTAGQTLSVDERSHAATLASVPVSQVAPWRNGQLIVDNQRLGDVIRTLARYVPGRIVLNDAGLADQRITGLYNLREPELALQAMLGPHGGHVRAFGGYLWIVSR
ncbi:transmembrane sensor [Pseudomonas sp. TE3610]